MDQILKNRLRFRCLMPSGKECPDPLAQCWDYEGGLLHLGICKEIKTEIHCD